MNISVKLHNAINKDFDLFGEVISSPKNEHPKIEKDKIIIKNILFINFIFKLLILINHFKI